MQNILSHIYIYITARVDAERARLEGMDVAGGDDADARNASSDETEVVMMDVG